MSNRVAKLENEDTWVVYQSTAGAMYVPMFRDALAAELFASVQNDDRNRVSDADCEQMRLASDCAEFVGATFGNAGAQSVPAELEREFYKARYDDDERPAFDFDDLMAEVQRGHDGVLCVLRVAFWHWRGRRTPPQAA